MDLNLPILDKVAGCKNLLIAGMGGGFDIFSGLPIYLELQKRGQNVHLANYSFSNIVDFPDGTRLTETLVGIDADHERLHVYAPELHMTKWFREKRNEDVTIWSFQKTGTNRLLSDYRVLVDHLKIDGILLIDGGIDSIARGDEERNGTVIEDSISLFVVNELTEIPVKMVGCVGLGAERSLSYPLFFENIAELTKAGAFLGSCSLAPQMWTYQAYEEAVLYAQAQPMQDPSVINSSIVSAVRGEYGDYHLTKKTKGSVLGISPLMSLYWFFELETVAEHNLFLSQLFNTEDFFDALEKYLSARRVMKIRENKKVFQT